jgi:glucokinase
MTRPVVRIDRVAAAGVLAGVDVGGSKIAVLVADRDRNVLGRWTEPLEPGSPDATVDQIRAAVEGALPPGTSLETIDAVGVGIPGRVEPVSGSVTLALNLGWRAFPLRDRLVDALGTRVVVENDVRAAAWGIHARRLVGPVGDLAYVSVGTGIAAGVVLGGRVHRGSRGLAGEIGHVVVDPSGAPCPCGLRGCLETVAAGPAIARAAGASSAAEVFAAAAAGDAVALEVTARAGRHLAWAIYHLALGYGIDRLVLGGGVARAGRLFIDPIEAELDRLRSSSALAAAVLPAGFIGLVPTDDETGAWGALLSVAMAGPDGSPRAAGEVSDRPAVRELTA